MPSIVKIPRTAVRRVAADQKPAPAQEARPIILYANDAYANPAAKLGYGADVLSEGVEYPLVRLTMNYMLLLSLYRGSGVLKKIVNKPVEDAIAHWYQITSQLSPEQTDMLAKLEKRTRLKKRIECGLKWGRLFGGAAGLIMIDGHGDILEQPLDLKTIEPDSFKGLYVVDRWSGLYPSTETVDDINDPDFGEPEFYNVRVSETATDNARVHHSRIVRFTGDELPYWETQVEQGWGASVIETIFDELRQYDDIRHNIAQLVYQANVWIQKSDDLAQSLALAPAAAQARLYATMQAQNRLMSSFTTRVIGKDDDISSRAYSFAGLDSVFTMCKEALSCVSEIPITILFGESPGGMNSTGESDLTNYYTKVEGIQENEIQPVLDRLLPIMCMSEFGAVPDDLDYKFGPVRVPSEEEKAELAGKKTEAVMKVYDGGLIGRKTALKELRDQSEDTGIFTNITDEMIDEADDEVQQGDMPGMPGFGGTPGMPGEETTPSAPGDVPTGPQDGPAPAQPSPTLQITPPAGQPPAPPQTQPTAAPRAPSEQREEDSAPIVAPSPQKSFAERVAGITNYILQRIRGTDTWAESEHPRDDDGKFTAGSGSSRPEKEDDADARHSNIARELKDCGSSAKGANRMRRGFSESNLETHWETHQHEYDGMTKEQYAARALELIQMPVGGDIHGYKNKYGQIVRYDARTNDFVKGHPGKGIAFMCKPYFESGGNGLKYYQKQLQYEGVEDD